MPVLVESLSEDAQSQKQLKPQVPVLLMSIAEERHNPSVAGRHTAYEARIWAGGGMSKVTNGQLPVSARATVAFTVRRIEALLQPAGQPGGSSPIIPRAIKELGIETEMVGYHLSQKFIGGIPLIETRAAKGACVVRLHLLADLLTVQPGVKATYVEDVAAWESDGALCDFQGAVIVWGGLHTDAANPIIGSAGALLKAGEEVKESRQSGLRHFVVGSL
jgi:hypothetical protein